jgi:hypothetical protein
MELKKLDYSMLPLNYQYIVLEKRVKIKRAKYKSKPSAYYKATDYIIDKFYKPISNL